MRIIALSDTHGNQPEVPDGDILIHAGDACNFGTDDEIRAALMWISSLPHEHKIFVPGNHDRELETHLSVWREITEDWGITMLVDESVTIQDVSFYGCPWTPQFMDWSFMRTDKQREQYWHSCDAEPDILITHGPPLGILDASGRENIGCKYLRKFVQKSAPHHHIFGHIHEGKGWMKGYDTEFHNVACRVAMIGKLYKMERESKELSSEARHQVRQEQSRPIVDKLHEWMVKTKPTVPPTLALGKAFQYLHNQWPRLIRYLDDGAYPIDNNRAENAIRPFVIGRKAWLFSATVDGAKASANWYSIIETAKANHLNPYTYLKKLLTDLPNAETVEEFEALLPWNIVLESQ